jgi:hypothetical protein
LLFPFHPLPSRQTIIIEDDDDEDEEDWNMTLNRYKSPGYYRVSLRDEVKTGVLDLAAMPGVAACKGPYSVLSKDAFDRQLEASGVG